MNEDIRSAANDVLSFLMDLSDENVQPDAAEEKFRQVRNRHEKMEMDLIWAKESLVSSFHYDALLHLPEQGSLFVTWCPDRSVPWLMRGMRHSMENAVVRVNGRTVTIETVMVLLDFIWNESQLTTDIVNTSIIQDAVRKREIRVTDDELQHGMDDFRQKRGLFTADDTRAWLEQQGMTERRFEDHIASELTAGKLREQISAGQVEQYFSLHERELDVAHIACFRVFDQSRASQLCDAIRSGREDFFLAAQKEYLAAEIKPSRPLFTTLRRRDFSPEQVEEIFSASYSGTVHVVESGDGFDVVRVLQIDQASLDTATRETAKELIFDEWLEKQRREASIEWFWGDADRAKNS